MKIIDIHTHVHFPVYDDDREEVIKRAQAVGVKMVCVGTQFSTSEAAIKLAEKYPDDIWATAGFHPNHIVYPDASAGAGWYHDRKEQSEAVPEKFEIEKLRELAKHPKVVAIGECGIDYYRSPQDQKSKIKNQNLQKEVFIKHIEVAKELHKPLMIHCRPSKGTDDAYEDLLAILHGTLNFSQNKIVHFYVGSLAITKKLVEAGFYFTFGGVITFARDYDEAIKYIPLDRILLETDAPYVAPEPYRGRRNEPSYIIETAKKMAELKNVSWEKVAEITTKTAGQVLKLS